MVKNTEITLRNKLLPKAPAQQMNKLVKLRICSCLACVYRVIDARGQFGEHERCVLTGDQFYRDKGRGHDRRLDACRLVQL